MAETVYRKIWYGVLIALIPAFLVSLSSWTGCLIMLLHFRLRAPFILRMGDRKIFDEETGLQQFVTVLLSSQVCCWLFNLPSNLPVWIIILGALYAIGVGKMSFGGLGCNPFNPALAGRVFLLLSFPLQMIAGR